jgi:hypothetical protein
MLTVDRVAMAAFGPIAILAGNSASAAVSGEGVVVVLIGAREVVEELGGAVATVVGVDPPVVPAGGGATRVNATTAPSMFSGLPGKWSSPTAMQVVTLSQPT